MVMKKYLIHIAWVLAAFFVVGCEDLEDTYDEYAGDGMIRYVGKNSDLEVQPGWYRLKVKWKDNIDAAIAKVKIAYQTETDAEPSVIYVEPKDITESDNLMDSIYLENLSDAVYTISVSNISVDSVESMVTTAYARPYTESHEDLRSFSRGIVNFYVIDDRMVVFLDEENLNIKEMMLNFWDTRGEKREWDILYKMQNATWRLGSDYIFLLPEEEGVGIDFDRPLVIERKGMLEGCIDTINFIPDTLDLSERVWSAGFTRWLTKEFGAGYTEEDINSVTQIDLDYDMVTFRDLFYFPNLEKVVLGKNRYVESAFADVNVSTTDEYSALVTLQYLREARGVETERYNNQYFGEISGRKYTDLLVQDGKIDADLITEMGNSNMDNIPVITPLETTGWEITCSDTLFNGYKSNGGGYLLDGRVDTYFEPGLTGSATVIELEFDMKEAHTLHGFKVVQPTTTLDPADAGTSADFETFMSYLLQSVKVEVSTDGYTWENATYEDGGITIGNAPGEITFIELPQPKQVQYIRLTVASQMVQSTREGVALFSLRLADFIPY